MTKSTSDVLDEREDAEVCLLPFRLFGRLRAVEGRVRTVRCFEDNLLLRSILARWPGGRAIAQPRRRQV